MSSTKQIIESVRTTSVNSEIRQIVIIESKRGDRGLAGESVAEVTAQISALQQSTSDADAALNTLIQQVDDANGIKTNDW